jgi:hypothetical protein
LPRSFSPSFQFLLCRAFFTQFICLSTHFTLTTCFHSNPARFAMLSRVAQRSQVRSSVP